MHASIQFCLFLVSDFGERRFIPRDDDELALVCTATELFHARPAEGKSIVPRTKTLTLPNTPFFFHRASVHEVRVTFKLLTLALFNPSQGVEDLGWTYNFTTSSDTTLLCIDCFISCAYINTFVNARRSIHPFFIRCEPLCH